MYKLLVILGPTATGKTDLALHLAKKFNGELVSCDSRQVYKGLDIGTGKMSNLKSQMSNVQKGNGFWKIDGVKVWMYDVVSLKKQYSVADYVNGVIKVIGEIKKRGKLPIVVGGTGLYLKVLIEGIPSLQIPIDKKLRKKLTGLSLQQLQSKLKKTSLKKWNSMNNSDQNNPRRLIRAIEIGIGKGDMGDKGDWGDRGLKKEFNILRIGLSAPREVLYKKINTRVYKWIEDGILEEVIDLRKKGVSTKRFKQLGLEYAVLSDYLDGSLSFDDMIGKMQISVRQYAKRQITWFKKEKNIIWFDISVPAYRRRVEKFIWEWYHNGK